MTDAALPVVYEDVVRPEWVDRNGHFNAGFYMVAFDTAVGPWFRHCGVDRQKDSVREFATFTAESHTLYLRELEPGEPFLITAQLLDASDKKIHTFLRMHRALSIGGGGPCDGDAVPGELVATNEILSLYVDLKARRPATLPDEVVVELRRVLETHQSLPQPSQRGRVLGVSARRPDKN
jgi:acyl-CoA thioester hydrolase